MQKYERQEPNISYLSVTVSEMKPNKSIDRRRTVVLPVVNK